MPGIVYSFIEPTGLFVQNIRDYIDSGILELYVMGLATDEENREIARLAHIHTEISGEIENIANALLLYIKAGDGGVSAHAKNILFTALKNQFK